MVCVNALRCWETQVASADNMGIIKIPYKHFKWGAIYFPWYKLSLLFNLLHNFGRTHFWQSIHRMVPLSFKSLISPILEVILFSKKFKIYSRQSNVSHVMCITNFLFHLYFSWYMKYPSSWHSVVSKSLEF